MSAPLPLTGTAPPAGAPPAGRRGAGLRGLSRWRLPLSIAILCGLPFLLPSKALAVDVLIYGLYAVGYDLLFGYTGLLSFGHAAFFGAGAYAFGIAVGQWHLNWLVAMATAIVVSGCLALVMGVLAIRTRGIYFAMVTLALAQLVYQVGLQASWLTGGENGLRGFTVAHVALPFVTIDLLNPTQKYYLVLAFVAVALWIMSRILASPFGGAVEAIRENETRARACGFNVERTKLLAFVLSGLFCGLAGALSALHLSIVPLDALSYTTSGTAIVMTMLGGVGTFFGPFIGALVYLVFEDGLSLWTPHWQLILGVIFVLFVLYLPRGLWGTLLHGRGRA